MVNAQYSNNETQIESNQTSSSSWIRSSGHTHYTHKLQQVTIDAAVLQTGVSDFSPRQFVKYGVNTGRTA